MDQQGIGETNDRRLLPPPAPAGASQRAGLSYAADVDYRRKYRGALIGGAIGDALGRPWEARGPRAALEDLSSLGSYRRWRGWTDGPIGTVTDDTQLTMCVAESISARGHLDPEDLARRFVEWAGVARGPGAATLKAVNALARGVLWDRAGVDSEGNGAAMRVAPVALLHPVDLESLRSDSALSAVITHATRMAVVSAIAQAFMVAWCLHRNPSALTADTLRSGLLAGLGVALDGVSEDAVAERRDDRPGRFRLSERLAEAIQMPFASPPDAFEYFHNGAFVLESLPAALWCFLRHWDDPQQAIVTAVSGGYDADTVAAMTGALVGALHGADAFPAPWVDELEYAAELRKLADSLLELASPPLMAGGSTSAAGASSLPTDHPARSEPRSEASPAPDRESRVLGCLLGGAIGDALGAPIEFWGLREIRDRYGTQGVTGYVSDGWPPGTFTDDTQMALFTAEGLIRAAVRRRAGKGTDTPLVIWHAYQRWLDTQGSPVLWDRDFPQGPSGWLVEEPALRHRRAPGTTCLSALASGRLGSARMPLNHSKGCGGVMRVAPIGLVADDPFDLACEAAALTHGHPSGYLAAGAFATVVAGVAHGEALASSIDRAVELLRARRGHEETLHAVEAAADLAASGEKPTPEMVETLGGGWVAEEALAITLYCALAAADFRRAVLLAVNHTGDSDSTGSMVGNLLGAALGLEALPKEWLEGLEERSLVEQVARDLAASWEGESQEGDWGRDRYPGW